MIITYTPCETRTPATWTQPAPDQLRCKWRGKVYEVDFSDSDIVEFDIPEEVRDVVHEAKRVDGVLHLKVPSLGPLKKDVTIDHGTQEVLGW